MKLHIVRVFQFVAFIFAIFFPLQSAQAKEESIILQSTTSTQNSGLFEHILPMFKAQSGVTVNVVAVGTGQALKNGRKGDGDVLLVHAKNAEEKFVSEGYGVKRFDVMYNDFVIVGPDDDPAGLAGMTDIVEALKKLAASKSPFVSRGDDSGTNKKELFLWDMANIDAASAGTTWYRETGSGMGATLNIASGMGAYTMSDRATWIAFANKGSLKIMSEGDPLLFNQYGVILINPQKHPHVNRKSGNIFIQWLIGPQGRSAISSYMLDGKQLFYPNAGSPIQN